MIRLVLSAALALAATAAAADDYYLDGYRENCPVGIGGEGIVSVGAGWFNSFDTRYERLGERQALGDGWFRATWACSAEGEDCGRERIDLRITEERLDLRFGDGRVVTGLNCPGCRPLFVKAGGGAAPAVRCTAPPGYLHPARGGREEGLRFAGQRVTSFG